MTSNIHRTVTYLQFVVFLVIYGVTVSNSCSNKSLSTLRKFLYRLGSSLFISASRFSYFPNKVLLVIHSLVHRTLILHLLFRFAFLCFSSNSASFMSISVIFNNISKSFVSMRLKSTWLTPCFSACRDDSPTRACRKLLRLFIWQLYLYLFGWPYVTVETVRADRMRPHSGQSLGWPYAMTVQAWRYRP